MYFLMLTFSTTFVFAQEEKYVAASECWKNSKDQSGKKYTEHFGLITLDLGKDECNKAGHKKSLDMERYEWFCFDSDQHKALYLCSLQTKEREELLLKDFRNKQQKIQTYLRFTDHSKKVSILTFLDQKAGKNNCLIMKNEIIKLGF